MNYFKMEEEQITIKKSPYSAASVRTVAKLEDCSISRPVFDSINENIDAFISMVPKDKVWHNNYQKRVICSREYFKFHLGKSGFSNTERENVRKNVEILLTNIIHYACKATKQYKKKIVQKDLVNYFISFYKEQFNQCEDKDMH